MAQDAELKLKVSLDLAFFRQQLSTVGAQLGGQSLQLNIQFNKKSIADQYRLLDTYIGRKTFKVKIESNTLDVLVEKVSTFKKNLIALGNEKINLAVNVTSNVDETRKSVKEKLSSVEVKTQLADPVNVDDFIRGVAKKVDDQVKKSYTAGGVPIATKLALPGIADPLKALQKNLNQKDPLRAKVSTTPSILKADVTAFKTAVSEKFKDITVKVRAELDTATTAAQGATAGPSRTFLQELKDLDKSALQNIYGAAGKDALLAFDEGIINNKAKMVQALSKAAEDASAGFIAALENKKSALFKAAGEYGGALLSGLKKTLKIQSPSREMFDIGDDAGKGFELGLLKAMELAEKSATSQMRRMLDRLARMALMMGGMSAAAINKQVAQSRALPSVNFPATVPPSQSIPIGPSSTGRTLPASRAAAGLIRAAQAPAGLLPSATRQSGLTTGLEALIQSLVSQSRGRGPEGPGSIVSMETGFIPAMRERFAKAAERYLFGVETQVMDLFDAALRQVESAVDLHIAKIQGQISQRMRSAFSVVDLGVQERPMLPSAATGQEPLMLPSAGGTTPQGQMRFNAVRTGEVIPSTPLMLPPAGGTTPRREMRFNAVTSTGGRGGGYVPPGGFPEEGMLGMLGGRQGPATFIGAGSQIVKLKANLDATVQSVEQFRKSQIPLAGAMQDLAGEFGNAAQQVLLYGTAYKALAFFVGLPGQALNAAKSLQTFNNQLNAITGSSENADRAFAFVDNLAARFNVPLESARQGFVKLYASMAPAGFSSGEIENLFSGISKASATLGLSSDKVDRVTYAFSQMASKGQLMSEEVSGQLGDVIPGALSIMAEAARMDIATFKKAMEDGVFVGETFKQVMSNVPIVLENRFGKGAAGAAKTLQGSMNALAISTQKFYESFEPIVSMGAASIFPIIAAAINNATQAVQAFTTAMQGNTTPAQMLEGNAAQIYGVLQQLREIFVAVAGVIQGIAPTLMIVGKTFLTTAEYVAKLINTPIGGFLADLAVKAGIALIAVQLLTKTGIVGLISQLILLQRSTAAAGGGLLTFAKNLTKTATAAKLFRLAITGLIGAGILFGIEALVNAIGRMANRLSDARKNAIAARDAIKSMTGAELGEQIIAQQNKLQALSRTQKAGGRIGSEKDRQALEQMGMKVSATGGTFAGGQLIGGKYAVDKNLIESFRIREKEQLKAIQDQRKSLYDTTPLPLNEVELGAGTGDEKATKKALNDAEQLAKQEQQRRIELANFANDMQKIEFDRDVQLSDAAFEHKKSLIDTLNEYELSGLNDIQARQVKFAQDLKKIQLNAVDAVRKALQKSQEAQLNVVAAQRTAQAAGGGEGPSVAGFTPAELSTATAAASKFTGIANMCSESVKAFYKSLGISLPGVTAWADTVRNAGTTMRDWSKLAPGDIVATGRPGDTPHVGVYTGGQNVFHQSRSRGLKAGNYPDLDYFKQGGYFVRPNGGMKQSSASFSMDTKMQKESFDLQKQLAQSTNQIALQSLEIERAIQLAKEQTAATIKANIDNIFPVEKQKLDLQLQQMRNNLILQGMPQEYIDYEEQRALKTEEAAAASSKMKDAINEAKVELGKYNVEATKGIDLAPEQKARMKILEDQIAANEEGLKKLTDAQRQSNIASLESAIATMKQADALKAMEEVSGRIDDAVEGVTGTYKSMFKEIAMGGDSVEALKKAQQALADQFLTMVFDMAMKPVEESMKNSLSKMFGVPTEKEKREESIKKMEEQLTQLKLIENNTAIAAGKAPASGTVPTPAAPIPGQTTAAGTTGGFLTGTAALQTLPFNGQTSGMLQTLPFNGEGGFLSSLGIDSDALSTSITDSANAYSEQLSKVDASVFESANALGTAGTELGKEGAAGKKWHESLGQAVGGLGMAAGAVMGIVAGINQIKEGGTSNVLGGIGMIASMAGSLLGSFGGLFGGGGGASSIVKGVDMPVSQMPAGMAFANGGIAFGGFRAFANGGTVSGPTLGLIGEGKYNEAVVPLPDGRSIPVQLGGRSARDMMGGNAPGMPQAPSLSMKFETTKINGVEYVSREQLEQAMTETRRASIAGGAARGMSMTLDKIQQSPSTRSRIGMR